MSLVDSSQQQLNVQVVEHGQLTWVNIERPGLAEMSYLKERYAFHQLALDDCLSTIQIPKLDVFDSYLFLVLHFPLFNRESRLTLPCEVDIFVGANYLVTVHSGNLRPLTKLFHDFKESEEVRRQVLGSSSGLLLYRILDGLVDNSFPILNRVIADVGSLEERIFDTRQRGILREMALVRRDILSYRRIVRPQIDVLEDLEEKEYPLLRVDPDIYFGDLADHMRRIWAELEDLKEVIEGLHDTHASLATYRSHDITRILTVAATLVLPFLVVATLYGMNVPLPLAEERWFFPVLLAGAGLVSAGMLLLFRLRRWL